MRAPSRFAANRSEPARTSIRSACCSTNSSPGRGLIASATLARDRAERINGFLQNMLGAADHGNLGRDAKLGDVLDTARRNAEIVLNADPATLGATELTLAKAYDTLGDLDNALQSVNSAL